MFEAKDKKLSKNEAWAELNGAMAARAAALCACSSSRARSGCPPVASSCTSTRATSWWSRWTGSEPEGLALETAYRLAAARLKLARDGDLQVDAAAVRDAAEEAVSTLKQAQAIRSSLTGIKTSSDKARANLDAMVEAVRAKLERIDSLIAEAEDEA